MLKTKRYMGDSFVVDITPPGKKEPHFPMVAVHSRNPDRKRGVVARKNELLIDGLPDPPNRTELDALAQKIGEAILSASPITRKWMRQPPRS